MGVLYCARTLAFAAALMAPAAGLGTDSPAAPSNRGPALVHIGLVETDRAVADSLLAGAESAVAEASLARVTRPPNST